MHCNNDLDICGSKERCCVIKKIEGEPGKGKRTETMKETLKLLNLER